MKKTMLMVVMMVCVGFANADWQDDYAGTWLEAEESSAPDISIQMESWYNTFGKDEDQEKEVEEKLEWKSIYTDCDTDASYLAK